MAPDPTISLAYLDVPKVAEYSPEHSTPCWWVAHGHNTYIACKCGRIARLSETHQIDNEGRVCPGVKCGRCGFEEHLKLQGWDTGFVELCYVEDPSRE